MGAALTLVDFDPRGVSAAEMQCTEQELREARRVIGIPTRTLDIIEGLGARKFAVTPGMRALHQWFNDDSIERGIAVLSGPPGTGKTLAACWFMYAFLPLREPVFATARELARMPRDERDAYHRDCLILDDVGAEHVDPRSSWLADFDELVDTLYSNDSTAIFTTNCTAAQFEKRYGARVVDRLAEVGTWIPVVGKSLRGAK